jgi:hypothetical protein
VISKLLAEAKKDATAPSKKEATLQEFVLGTEEYITGYLPAFVDPLSLQKADEVLPRSDSSTGSNADAAKSPLMSPGSVPQSPWDSDTDETEQNLDTKLSEPLEGFFVFTQTAIYELKANKRPEEIFFTLVSNGLEKTKAESLGLVRTQPEVGPLTLVVLRSSIMLTAMHYFRHLD